MYFCLSACRNTILVGHSLENDLIALKLYHDRVIDSAIVYAIQLESREKDLRKLRLKHLAREYVGRRL